MDSNPSQLVTAARVGDKQAAVRLIEQFYERIYAFLRRLAGSDADAADLTQRTFGRAWQALDTFEGRSSVSSWLHAIAHHVYVDWRRSNHRLETRSEAWWQALPARSAGPDQLAAHADLADAVYRGVDQLEPDLRETVHLHYYQGLTLDETAATLGIAASTVKWRLRQALTRLQNRLDDSRPISSSLPSSRLP